MAAPIRSYLDFEKPVAELEAKVQELRALVAERRQAVSIGEELTRLESKAPKRRWPISMPASRPGRKRTSRGIRSGRISPTIVEGLFDRFHAAVRRPPVWRRCRDRRRLRLVSRHARLRHRPGERHRYRTARIKHNFGMARPEGYRKAVRLMQLADRFDLPVISLVDTPGAFPGVDAEERGQAEAIAPLDRRVAVARRAQYRGRSSARAAPAAPSPSPPAIAC